jgi:mevalonate kinase
MPKKSTISYDDYQDTYSDHSSQGRNLSRIDQKEVQKKASVARRNIKTYDQIIVLNKYYAQDPSWNRQTVQKCKKLLDLKTSVIYKWGYDRKQAEIREKQQEILNRSQKRRKYLTDNVEDYNATVEFIISQLKQNSLKTHKADKSD